MKSPKLLGQKTLFPTLFHLFDLHIAFMYPNDPFGIPNFHVQPPHLQPFASCEMHSQPRLLSKFVQDHWDPWPSCANIAGNHPTSSWRPGSCRGTRKCPSGQRNAQFDFKLSTKVSCAAFEEPDSGVQKSASMRRCPPKSLDRRMDIPHVCAQKTRSKGSDSC